MSAEPSCRRLFGSSLETIDVIDKSNTPPSRTGRGFVLKWVAGGYR
jgi:hypothetical protein